MAHDAGSCHAGQSSCSGDINCVATGQKAGICFTTTGKAPYCAPHTKCFRCRKDADCRKVCGARAACVACPGSCEDEGGTLCVGVEDCELPAP